MLRTILLFLFFLFYQSASADYARFKYVLEKHDICDYQYIRISKDSQQQFFMDMVFPGPLNPGYEARAFVGHYIGLNHGKITRIDKNSFHITELHFDGNGGWFPVEKKFQIKKYKIANCAKVNTPPKYKAPNMRG